MTIYYYWALFDEWRRLPDGPKSYVHVEPCPCGDYICISVVRFLDRQLREMRIS